MIRIGLAFAALLAAVGGAAAQTAPWQVPAPGGPLTTTDVQRLDGKACWGWFDRGSNSDNSRGAVYVTFGDGGRLWRKWGQEARTAPRRDRPEGYDDMGRLGPVRLSDTRTEVTFKAENWFFDWFIRPGGDGTYALRAIGTTDRNRGAIGQLTCP